MKVMRLAACIAAFSTLTAAQPEVQVDGSGTTNPNVFFMKIMETIQARSRRSLRLTYRAIGSSSGQREFSQSSDGDYAASLSDFGAGDIPMSNSRWQGITDAGREMAHVPFCLGAIAIFHSVPANEVGPNGLHLSPCVLAKILDGTITTWDDALIMAENPDLNVPAGQEIKVGHRTHGSSSTTGVTGYLAAKCSTWALGSGSTITWPTSSGFTPVEGSPGMTEHIANVPYAIGYLDAGHGHNRGFQEAYLKNEADNWLTSTMAIETFDNGINGVAAAADAAVSDGDVPTSVTADWSAFNLYGKPGANTWPIVLVSYVYVHKDWASLSADKAGLLKAFLDYVTDANLGQSMLADFKFNSLPPTMNTWQDTWTNVITQPVSVTNFELMTSTQNWLGMAPDVITSKRGSYSLWKLEELDLAVTALQAQVSEMSQSLNDYGIVPLHGSGTTNPKTWFAEAMKLMEHRARVPLLLTYRAVGSSTGQAEFVGDSSSQFMSYNHFGAGDIPMSSTNYATLSANNHDMVHIPVALGAIGIFHNVPGNVRVQLTACLLAKIFSGQITTWDHAEILAENPDLSPPANQPIKVAHRTRGSSSTGGVSGYLDAKCSDEDWPLGAGSSLTWPTHSNFQNVEGSPGMQAYIEANEWSLGYLDAGHGHQFGLHEIALTNADGQSRTSEEAMALEPHGVAAAGTAGVSANRFPSDFTADWSAVNLYDMPGPNTWPIVLVTYLYVKQDQTATNPKTAAALKAFIDVILTDADGLAVANKFSPLSDDLRAFSVSAANSITYPAGMVPFTFETSTQVRTGMGVNVISSKRHAFDDYERDRIEGLIEDMSSSVSSSGASGSSSGSSGSPSSSGPTPTPTPTPSPTPSPSASPSPAPAPATDEDDGGPDVLVIVALIVSIVAVLLSSVAICLARQGAKASGGGGAGGQMIGNSNI